MKILAVDPGEKNIGLAISDELGISAKPLAVIIHIQREKDAARVAEIATEKGVELIIIGQSLDDAGKPTFTGRKSARFAKALRAQTEIPVKLWDEFRSTQIARETRVKMGVSRKKRGGHLDDVAAAVILQSYLDREIEN
ncbi:MAG: Holliday junction resolvase RuvX [Anaerolineae bacterium]|jgi:putative holliday junction resolvase|nr:Holliday junction resolvase RuvX [Anaerolineae bacterium]MBT7190655.1 Holliday junction resolvase RuvX [Anaerolineae bacterium]MBT7990557.1 Holliday junction resolvase RuvX [Anaerolineae bacterium]